MMDDHHSRRINDVTTTPIPLSWRSPWVKLLNLKTKYRKKSHQRFPPSNISTTWGQGLTFVVPRERLEMVEKPGKGKWHFLRKTNM
jgi:hypothetical protein